MKTDVFANRHIGITDSDLPRMLGKIGVKTRLASSYDRTRICRTHRPDSIP